MRPNSKSVRMGMRLCVMFLFLTSVRYAYSENSKSKSCKKFLGLYLEGFLELVTHSELYHN